MGMKQAWERISVLGFLMGVLCVASPAAAAPARVDRVDVVAANGSVGLDWPRVPQASGYRVYWSTVPGVEPARAAHLDSREPASVHRGLRNGTGYHYVVTAIVDGHEGPPSPEVSATPGGAWVLEELGAGDFDDVLTGARVPRVPLKDRIHVHLFADGYRAEDLPTLHDENSHARRANDVDRWVDEIFAIEPYRRFRAAFVVWYLPRPSAHHLGEGQTAFKVGVVDDGVERVQSSAGPLFAALNDSRFPLTPQAANHVAAILLYDPQAGRAGFSGLSLTLANPADLAQSLPCAFGIDHAHEFTHAFASLRDEYLEDRNRSPALRETCNIAPRNRCDELPWAHLLAGRGINSTPSLVGAFGSPQHGFHPELLCLMNGMHDNGQYYCASGAGGAPRLGMRVNRLCNFCREIATFRIFERSGLLPENAFTRWKASYRAAFYQRFGFETPPSPQAVRCPQQAPRAVFQGCAS
jgi:hypothetical protein